LLLLHAPFSSLPFFSPLPFPLRLLPNPVSSFFLSPASLLNFYPFFFLLLIFSSSFFPSSPHLPFSLFSSLFCHGAREGGAQISQLDSQMQIEKKTTKLLSKKYK
jgi:hypothetical protein